ncbi:MAG: hypothetical protein AB7O88_03065 [Reyranellaceae bacterium]
MLLIPVIRALVAARALSARRVDAVAAQRRTLARLLRVAAGTHFGSAHDFGRLPDRGALDAGVVVAAAASAVVRAR